MSAFTINFLVQLIAGVVGSNAAAMASREHSFGAVGHTLVGAVGGALSGYFLQTLFVSLVDGTGAQQPPRAVDNAMIQALSGLVVGAIAMFLIGMLKHVLEQHNASR